MANIKFSEFTEATAIGDMAFVVGYDGSTNKRILAADLLGNYLPLAGGTMTGNINLNEGVRSKYGETTADLKIYHSTNSFIVNGSTGGNINIQNFQNSGDITFTATYNNTTKQFMRIDGGANRIIVSEDMNFDSGDKLILNDNLRIYSSGNDSFITELDNTGILYIQAGADLKLQSSGNEDYIVCNENSSVELYHNNVKKLETTSTGVNITGEVRVTGAYYDSSNSAGTNGQVLSSTGNGTTTAWVAAGGGGGATELNDLTDCFVATGASGGVSLATIPFSGSVGDRNTIIGKNAATFSTTSLLDATIMGHFAGYNQVGGNGSTYIGSYAGYNQTSTSSFSNIFVGTNAGYGAVGASGSGNVGVGKDSMVNITSGSKNMAMGYRSLRNLQSGSSNIAIGHEAGEGVTTQWYNVLIGQETLENSNSSSCVAIGHQAMDTSSNVGGFCVAVGYQAGRNFNTQQGLIAIGYQASYSHTSGGDCVTIGRSAGYSNTTGQQRTIVGSNAAQYNTGNGNTAIGYWALKGPSSGTVNGGFNVAVGRNAMDVLTTGSFNTAIGNDSAENLQSGFFNTYLGRDSGTGHINGTNCTFVGNAAAPSTTGASNEIVLGDASVAALRCQVTSITALSDRRDKTKIEDSNYGLNVIDKLKPVTFDWNTRDGAKVGIKDLGFIAQDLQKVDDENLKLVYDTNPEKLEASYGRLIPVLVKAIQELKAEIEILKS